MFWNLVLLASTLALVYAIFIVFQAFIGAGFIMSAVIIFAIWLIWNWGLAGFYFGMFLFIVAIVLLGMWLNGEFKK
jgi:hypothetical protein|tara:strand:+ start:576 stop:803 length:228 start_codon:yes stop_codon:yes gene_type:complete